MLWLALDIHFNHLQRLLFQSIPGIAFRLSKACNSFLCSHILNYILHVSNYIVYTEYSNLNAHAELVDFCKTQ